jgi:predicted MPP superfamily phosphohydrolase
MRKPSRPLEPKSNRSRLITRRRVLGALLGAIALPFATVAYGEDYEADHLTVTRTDVPLAHWPSAANGVRVGQLSDFHVDYDGALIRTRRAVAMMLDERPDVIFVTGDYVSNHYTRRFLEPTIDALAPLAAMGRGAYAIMGNHDWWGGNTRIATRLLRKAGFTVLNNASAPFPGVPGAYIIGLDDAWVGAMRVKKALRGVPPSAPKLVALHEPDFADSIGPGFDLQLSGHSHGGQIRVPGLPVLHAPMYGRRYPEGLQQARHHLVYTTRGIGMIGPQIRTFCPPEVTVLTLRTA